MVKAIDKIKAWAKENVQLITILPENKNLQVDTRLKDVLEVSVGERYYLSEEKTAALVAQLDANDGRASEVGGVTCVNPRDVDGTQTLQHGRVYKTDGLMTTLQASMSGRFNILDDGLPIREATRKGYAVASEGDAVNFQFPNSATRRGRVGKQIANTLEANGVNQGVVTLEQSGVEYSRKTGVGKQLEVAHCLSASDWRGLNRNQTQTAVAEVKQLGNVNPSGRGMNGAVYDIDAGLSPTLTTNKGEGQRIAEAPYYRIRKLTPLECFRLQSFPDWAYHEAAEVNSNSQLYKQAGNSVTVNVIHEIAKHLN